MATLVEIGWQFGILSLLAFGGGNAVLPEMQRIAVETNHWMSAETFSQLFAIAQAAPGPNILVVTLIGWQVAGLAGAVVATVALCGPSSLLIYALAHVWARVRSTRWRRAIEAGVAPLAVGLVLAGGYLIARTADVDWRTALLTMASTAIVLRWRPNPLWLIGLGALLGLLGAF
jgi:chromate transporter